jgi:hypothetical protein
MPDEYDWHYYVLISYLATLLDAIYLDNFANMEYKCKSQVFIV